MNTNKSAIGLATYFLHLYVTNHRVAVCAGELTDAEAAHVMKLGAVISPRGLSWDLHTREEEVKLVADISDPGEDGAALLASIAKVNARRGLPPPDPKDCGPDDASGWTPEEFVEWWKMGVGGAMYNCRFADFCFWLGAHWERLHGKREPLETPEGWPDIEARERLVPTLPEYAEAP